MPKGVGGYHHPPPVVQEIVLIPAAFFFRQPGMVAGRLNPRSAQVPRRLPPRFSGWHSTPRRSGLPSRRIRSSAAFCRRMPHFKIQVLSVEAGGYQSGILHPQDSGDIFPHLRGRGRRKRTRSPAAPEERR